MIVLPGNFVNGTVPRKLPIFLHKSPCFHAGLVHGNNHTNIENQLHLQYDLGIPFVPSMTAIVKKAIPMDLVTDMQLTGRRLTAEECEARLIISKACAMDELVDEAMSFAKGLNEKRAIVTKLKSVLYMDILKVTEVDDTAALKSLDLQL